VLRLGAEELRAGLTPPSRAYWDLRAVAHAGLEAQASGAAADPEEFEALLERPSGFAWWPTCRWAPSCRAGSTAASSPP
jgi:hypothetical protein